MSRKSLLEAGAIVTGAAVALYAACRFFGTEKKEADIDFFRYSASAEDCRNFFGTTDIVHLLVRENKITDGITVYNVPAKDGKQVKVIFDNQEPNPTVHIKNAEGAISSVIVNLDTLPKKNMGPADERQVTATGDKGTALKAAMHVCRMLEDPKQLTSQKVESTEGHQKVSFAF